MGEGAFSTKSHSGAALIIIVLVGFIVLTLVSAAVVTMAWNTLRVESWQTEQIEKTRLDYLARTAAKAVTEKLVEDPDHFGILNRKDINSDPKTVAEGDFSAELGITIRGDDQRVSVIAKTTSQKGGSAVVRATIDLTSPLKTVTWSSGN